jgi:hypothetical protein
MTRAAARANSIPEGDEHAREDCRMDEPARGFPLAIVGRAASRCELRQLVVRRSARELAECTAFPLARHRA